MSSDLAMLRGGDKNRQISIKEVAEHSSKHDCWVILFGVVYNITPFLPYHPGGLEILAVEGGKDVSDLFDKNHRWVSIEMISHLQVGTLADDIETPSHNEEDDESS